MTKLVFGLDVERSTERPGACNYEIIDPWGRVHVAGARLGTVEEIRVYFKSTMKRLNERFIGQTRGYRFNP
ncbi:MAG: hypothetical protein DIZ78_09520 [endosymbiont of Escarpia spicata]|uniref:Uncharacterized protein n=1 Tax=endosymbiont of Escarpia spicata TaxID=2200908 RepID=A0A370DNB1_9GAMM|nr:MAG: hypothetical protein DIZ78_09520 [endosymbiont of Escarpia spicata]